MTEIIDQTKPSEADGPATEKTGGQGLTAIKLRVAISQRLECKACLARIYR